MPKGQRWFRFYSAVLHCAKAQQLSDRHYRGWVNVLCAASENDGVLPEITALAFKLRMRPIDAGLLLQALSKAKLLDQLADGRFMPHDWNEHQYVSDVSTKRVKAFRERSRNVSETPSDTDTDTDADTEQKQSRAEAAAPPAVSITDEESGWTRMIELWSSKASAFASGVDWQKALQYGWRPLSQTDKLAAINWLHRNHGPFMGSPKGWLENRGWERVANPNAPTPQRERPKSAADIRLAELIARGKQA
jgi:hypothetical protein